MRPGTVLKRLHFLHLSWLALVVAAAVWGVQAGLGRDVAIIAGMGAACPALAGLLVLRTDTAPGDSARALMVIAWTLVALLGLLTTGGGGSPLTILLLAAPLTALLLCAPRMAAEAAVFAGLAFFGILAGSAAGLVPATPGLLAPMAAPLAFAGMVLAGLMIWFLLTGDGAHARLAEAALPNLADAVPPSPPAAEAPDLPGAGGVALLDVTPEGRLRSVSGDRFGLRQMRPGAALSSLFMPGLPLDELVSAPQAPIAARLAGGRAVRLIGEAHPGGLRLLVCEDQDSRESVAALEAARAEADDKLKERTAFFAALGHDLKTPLNAILGYSDIMRSELRGPMPEAYADYPGIIHESGMDLLLLVDDILDLAKADSGRHRLELEPVNLTASAESVIRQMEGQAARYGIKLRLRANADVWAEADARAVRQIWQNLVSNAIKYSREGTSVVLDTRLEAGAAELSVTDRGAGIAEDDLRTITEPFTQGQSARPGTGLGLAVVRRFAELHGGEIRIRSKLGRGTRVEITLPPANPADIIPLEDAAE